MAGCSIGACDAGTHDAEESANCFLSLVSNEKYICSVGSEVLGDVV